METLIESEFPAVQGPACSRQEGENRIFTLRALTCLLQAGKSRMDLFRASLLKPGKNKNLNYEPTPGKFRGINRHAAR